MRENEFKEYEYQFEHLDEAISMLTTSDFYNERIGFELTVKGGKGLFY